jgi:outer membrane immunogenic protein
MRYAILLPLAVTFAAVPAQAQNEDFPMWRVEANVGYDRVEGELTYSDSANPGDDFSESESTDGLAYGATVGVDVPVGNIYLGVEAGIDFASNSRCTEVFGDDAACFDVERNFFAGGRVGFPLGKKALAYVGAAYVNGKAEISYEDELDPTNNLSLSDTQDGYRLSAGIEARVTGQIFAKAEYRYSDYGDFSASDGTQRASLGFDRHQVMTGIGLRF